MSDLQQSMFDYEGGQTTRTTFADSGYQHRMEDAYGAAYSIRQCVRLLRIYEDQRAVFWFRNAVAYWERAGCELHAATAEEAEWFSQQLSETWWRYGGDYLER